MTLRAASPDAAPDPILSIEAVGKIYGQFHALRDVTFEVHRGSIYGLLGENGAGKSTLVGIISGQKQASSGAVRLNGGVIENADVQSMEEAGVFLVTQEPMIIDHLTAAENLMLGVWPERRGFVNWRKLKADAARMLEGTNIPPAATAGRLDAVSRRKLNILRAMFSGGKVIILDEPTAALTVEDRNQLFDFMRRLKAEGVTFIFISHYNDEILDICDRVSVLRDGELAGGSDDVSALSSEDLSALVLGRDLELFQRERRDFSSAEPAITLRNVSAGHVRVDHLDIHPGEILGFTGLPGAGAKELARCLFGLPPADLVKFTSRKRGSVSAFPLSHPPLSPPASPIFRMTGAGMARLGACRSRRIFRSHRSAKSRAAAFSAKRRRPRWRSGIFHRWRSRRRTLMRWSIR